MGSSLSDGGVWIVHQTDCFHSLSLHASRQLSDKVLRYLKRVIVTPAVYRSFDPLEQIFRCRHWAGFGLYTHPFELAETYVFIKQSVFSCHCDQ